MAIATFTNWNGWAITTARVFLASTLLLSASVGLSHLTFHAAFVFGFELLLGATIGAGWLIRHAAILVLLGTSAARVLAPHSHLALVPANTGITVSVFIARVTLLC